MSPDGGMPRCASTDDGRTWQRIASPLDEPPPPMDRGTPDATTQTSGSQMGADPTGGPATWSSAPPGGRRCPGTPAGMTRRPGTSMPPS